MIAKSTLYLIIPLMAFFLVLGIASVLMGPLSVERGGSALMILQGVISVVIVVWIIDHIYFW